MGAEFVVLAVAGVPSSTTLAMRVAELVVLAVVGVPSSAAVAVVALVVAELAVVAVLAVVVVGAELVARGGRGGGSAGRCGTRSYSSFLVLLCCHRQPGDLAHSSRYRSLAITNQPLTALQNSTGLRREGRVSSLAQREVRWPARKSRTGVSSA